MLPQKKPGQDDQPQVKRRFVGICLSLQSKGKHVPVFYGLVCNLEVPELIVRSEIPEQHHRQKTQGGEDESQ